MASAGRVERVLQLDGQVALVTRSSRGIEDDRVG
jgi:hypothetical protein